MEFIQKYERVDGSHYDDDEMLTDAEGSVVRDEFVDDNFMDGSPQNGQNQDLRTYRLTNVTRDLQKTLPDQSVYEYSGYCSSPENFVPDSFEDIEYDFDEFVGLKKGLRNSPAI